MCMAPNMPAPPPPPPAPEMPEMPAPPPPPPAPPPAPVGVPKEAAKVSTIGAAVRGKTGRRPSGAAALRMPTPRQMTGQVTGLNIPQTPKG